MAFDEGGHDDPHTDVPPAAWVLALACLALPPVASAVTYTVDVQPTLNDLPIKIEPVPFDGRLVMRLTNSGTSGPLRPAVRPSPQPIRRSTSSSGPGRRRELAAGHAQVVPRHVAVTCTPAER